MRDPIASACRNTIAFFLLTIPLLIASAAQERSITPGGGALGKVHFATSCSPKAQASFDRAVALLHSFEFGRAIDGFQSTLAADPACAMADWGIALSNWGNPFAPEVKSRSSLQQGRAAIEAANAAKPKTQRERDYIAAAGRLYERFENTTQQKRVDDYCNAMSSVAARYPGDTEASIFYALSLAMSADPSDKTYAKQLRAGKILEKLFIELPRHPGVAHYIIHSYDYPPLAARALPAARAYAKIAPDSPHALHMPSHIFTRLGLWDESIRSNIASVAASRREATVTEELHASDYLMYAYLQEGRDEEAERLVRALPEIESRFDPNAVPRGAAPVSAAYFAIAAIPARYVLERHDWAASRSLQVRATDDPYTDAITWFARGMGAANLSEIAVAQDAARQLAVIHQHLMDTGESYWAAHVEIQNLEVLAWTALAQKDFAGAVDLMERAVEIEDGTEKSAVTPGPIAPARELLAEMFLRLNRPFDALQQFRTTLIKEPNRFRSLYGAAHAASLAGNAGAAREYAAALLKVCAHADRPGRAELVDARALASSRSASE